MLIEEERLSGDLTGRSSGWQSEFLCKRNLKEDGEWMQRRIMRFSMLFIWRRREGIQYHRGETVDGEWNSSMLPDDASIFLGLGGGTEDERPVR
jgi:hypothetical protein